MAQPGESVPVQLAAGLLQLRQSLFETEQHRKELKRQLAQHSELEQSRLALEERGLQLRSALGAQHAATSQFDAETHRMAAESEARIAEKRIEDQRSGLALRIQSNLAKGVPQVIPDSLRPLVKAEGGDYHTMPLEGGGGEYVIPLVSVGKDETGADIKKPYASEQLRASLEKIHAQTVAELQNAGLRSAEIQLAKARTVRAMHEGAGALQLNSASARLIKDEKVNLERARNEKIATLRLSRETSKQLEASKYEADPFYGMSEEEATKARKVYSAADAIDGQLQGLVNGPSAPLNIAAKMQALDGLDLQAPLPQEQINATAHKLSGKITREGLIINNPGAAPGFFPVNRRQRGNYKLGPNEGFGYEETYYGPQGERVGRAYLSEGGHPVGPPIGLTPYTPAPTPAGAAPGAPTPPGNPPLGPPSTPAPALGPSTSAPSALPLSPEERQALLNFNKSPPPFGSEDDKKWKALLQKAGIQVQVQH